MADIDLFKRLNDTAGHAAGDECIRRVAEDDRESVRSGDDAVFRYGGEEFLIVLTHATPDLAWTIAERIRSAVEALAIVNPGIRAGGRLRRRGDDQPRRRVRARRCRAGDWSPNGLTTRSTTPSAAAGTSCSCRPRTRPMHAVAESLQLAESRQFADAYRSQDGLMRLARIPAAQGAGRAVTPPPPSPPAPAAARAWTASGSPSWSRRSARGCRPRTR